MDQQQSAFDLHALALAMAVLDAKKIGADRVRLSDSDGVVIDDFPLGLPSRGARQSLKVEVAPEVSGAEV